MDQIDKQILWILDDNCRISYKALGDRLGLTANAVRKRIDKLIETGVIIRFLLIPHNALMDAEFVFILVYTDGSENSNDMINEFGNYYMIHHVSPLATTKGGAYFLFGQYSGTEDLSQMGSFLRGLKSVSEIEIHGVPYPTGNKFELKRAHKIVLRVLLDNPRKSITEITRQTGYTARRVRRILDEIIQSESIRFTVRWDMNAIGSTSFFERIKWDQSIATIEDVVEQLERLFPSNYWNSWTSATEPIIFVRFIVKDLSEAFQISSKINEIPSITSTSSLVTYSTYDFPWMAEAWLRNKLSEIDG